MFPLLRPRQSFKAKFEHSLTLNNATKTADGQSIPAGSYVDVAVYKTPAGQVRAPGTGAAGATDTRGILYVSLKDNSATPVQIEGWVRIIVRDPSGVISRPVLEERTEVLRASKTDRNLAYRLGEAAVKAKEDSEIVLQVMADSSPAGTFSKANSDVLLPVTVYVV